MVRTLREIGPLGAVTVVAGAAVLWLLGANPSAGRWLLAALLFAHGWVHVMFLFPKPARTEDATATAWPFDLGTTWLARHAGTARGAVVAAGRVLVVATFLASLLAALATAGILVPAGGWPSLVLASAVASAVLLLMAFHPNLLLGFLIDGFLAWLVLAGPWRPG
jgi:hypothetical protein